MKKAALMLILLGCLSGLSFGRDGDVELFSFLCGVENGRSGR